MSLVYSHYTQFATHIWRISHHRSEFGRKDSDPKRSTYFGSNKG